MGKKRKVKKQQAPPVPASGAALAVNRDFLLLTAILGCFFLSGMAGLVYEVLWVKLFDKVIGSAPFAVASVLTVFMAGLAGGSYIASRKVDRVRQPGDLLVAYGILECAIGLYALVLPFLVKGVKPLYLLLYNQIFHQFWLYNLISFAVCFILLVIPAALMGATVPILMKFYVRRMDRLGQRAGRLYGINTAGAALGVILAGFFLVQRFGVWGTIFIVAAVNLGVGLISIYLGRLKRFQVSESGQPPAAVPSRDAGTAALGSLPKGIYPALILFAVSGFSAMGYQVIWSRLIGLLIAPTTYSFSLVVATFIVGLALGNFCFGWLADRSARTYQLLIATQIAAAILALGVSQFLGNSQLFFAKFIFSWKGEFGQMMVLQFVLLFLILLGPTIFLGAAFPLVSKLYTTSLQHVGRSIGVAYTINTVGAILGSFTAGFILIPFLGKENGLSFIVALQLGAGFLAWGAMLFRSSNPFRQFFPLVIVLVVALAGVIRFPDWNRQVLSYGRYQNLDQMALTLRDTTWWEAFSRGARILQEKEKGREVVFYGDGIGGFTTVERQRDFIGNDVYTLLNSGKPDATSHGDAATQAILAHAPLLFHPDAKKVMVLGAGSGMTAGEALLYPIDELDVLEINEQVVEASRFFTPWNNDYLNDPRTRVIVQDGRNHLSLWDGRYDVVISEPSNPWMAGMANLYTKEFFQTVESKLNSGGIFIQWVNVARMDWQTMAMIGRTFSEVFEKNCLMLSPIGASDYFFIGFKEGDGLSLANAQANLDHVKNSAVMTLRDARLMYYLIVSENIGKMFSDGQLHTDNWPRLEFLAPKNVFKNPAALVDLVIERREVSPVTDEIVQTAGDMDMMLKYIEFTASLYPNRLTPFDVSLADQTQLETYYRIIEDYCGKIVVDDYTQFADDRSREICSQIQLEKMADVLPHTDQKADVYKKMGIVLARRGEFDKSIQTFRKSLALDAEDPTTHFNLALVFAMNGELEAGRKKLIEAIVQNPFYVDSYVLLAKIDLRQGNPSEAKRHLRKALEIEEHQEARQLLERLQN
ncbi:MAG: fused MFS/spermidine synthase [Desulfobacterales bacterium]|nr:fused MFS/spermidine synthase [Desulfobacterales bacterium]